MNSFSREILIIYLSETPLRLDIRLDEFTSLVEIADIFLNAFIMLRVFTSTILMYESFSLTFVPIKSE